MIYTHIFDEEVESALKSFRQAAAVAVYESNVTERFNKVCCVICRVGKAGLQVIVWLMLLSRRF
jgi:hypothetical protein